MTTTSTGVGVLDMRAGTGEWRVGRKKTSGCGHLRPHPLAGIVLPPTPAAPSLGVSVVERPHALPHPPSTRPASSRALHFIRCMVREKGCLEPCIDDYELPGRKFHAVRRHHPPGPRPSRPERRTCCG